MNAYEVKQAERRARLEAQAAAKRAEAEAQFAAAQQISDMIPFGQPILVGHHSEKRHRRDIKKFDNHHRKGFAHLATADELEDRAAAVGTGGISADDPAALEKLRAQRAALEAAHARAVAANKLIRKNDRDGLAALGYTPDDIAGLPVPRYALANSSANIRRLTQRIAVLEARRQTAPTIEAREGQGWKAWVDAEENRVMLKFDERLSKEHYQIVRRAAFLWSPRRDVFVRKYSAAAWQAAQQVIRQLGME